MAIALGPFELRSLIGRGGMGHVWSGVHRDLGVGVAVKVVTGRAAVDPQLRAAFRQEVRAVAGLDHPRIVHVLDHGEVPVHSPDERLAPGAPYLAMELVPFGTLHQARDQLDWPRLRTVLLGVLDGLAHAHARGVVHRDLKPGNVLLAESGPKLGDFGIAHLADTDDVASSLAAGTPSYMSPEQIEHRWRDYGPWTDLYSLGCVGWALTTGHAPFRATEPSEWLRLHATVDPPPWKPRFAVPTALEDWLRRLLEKHPRDRYARAADAAWDLIGLRDADREAEQARPIDPSGARTTLVWTTGSGRAVQAAAKSPAGPTAKRSIPPIPPSWKRGPTDPRDPRFVGAGIGLWGLRTAPLVGREGLRDMLWEGLQQTARTGRTHAALLTGPAGCGKSRLAEWLCERAHEVGAGTVLRAVHTPFGGPHQGLEGMLRRWFATHGLDRAAARERVETGLREIGAAEAFDADALTEIVSPDPGPAPAFRFGSARERYVVVRRLLRTLCRERPLVVWLDDVQWGLDTLGFVGHVLATREPLRALIVMTANDEALADRPAEASLIRGIAADPTVATAEVGALAPAEAIELVKRQLRLDSRVARMVAERAAGNPLFAVQIVGDWVLRGVLVPGARGFRLAAGVRPELPDDLHAMWSARLDAALADRPEGDGYALEVAAALGHEVDLAEWAAACAEAGLAPSEGLVDALVTGRLARSAGGVVTFEHGLLRESLERRAREGGRYERHNAACAAMLEARGAERSRLGRHLAAGGRPADAAKPLLDAALQAHRLAAYALVHQLLDERDAALRSAGTPPEDPAWAEGPMLRVLTYWQEGRPRDGLALAEKLVAAVERHSWTSLRLQSLLRLTQLVFMTRDLPRAEGLAKALGRQAREAGDRGAEGAAYVWLGQVRYALGDRKVGTELSERALEIFREVGDVKAQAGIAVVLGSNAVRRGAHEAGSRLLAEGLAAFERLGERGAMVPALAELAELERARGELAAAEAIITRARAIADASGHVMRHTLRFNLALVRLAQGDAEGARELIAEMHAERAGEEQPAMLPHMMAAEIVLAAMDRAWNRAETWIARLDEHTERTRFHAEDIATLLWLASDVAEALGRPDAAFRCRQRADAFRDALGADHPPPRIGAEPLLSGKRAT